VQIQLLTIRPLANAWIKMTAYAPGINSHMERAVASDIVDEASLDRYLTDRDRGAGRLQKLEIRMRGGQKGRQKANKVRHWCAHSPSKVL
jgi:hypothetical protein